MPRIVRPSLARAVGAPLAVPVLMVSLRSFPYPFRYPACPSRGADAFSLFRRFTTSDPLPRSSVPDGKSSRQAEVLVQRVESHPAMCIYVLQGPRRRDGLFVRMPDRLPPCKWCSSGVSRTGAKPPVLGQGHHLRQTLLAHVASGQRDPAQFPAQATAGGPPRQSVANGIGGADVVRKPEAVWPASTPEASYNGPSAACSGPPADARRRSGTAAHVPRHRKAPLSYHPTRLMLEPSTPSPRRIRAGTAPRVPSLIRYGPCIASTSQDRPPSW